MYTVAMAVDLLHSLTTTHSGFVAAMATKIINEQRLQTAAGWSESKSVLTWTHWLRRLCPGVVV